MRLPRVLRPISRLVSALQGVKTELREVSKTLTMLWQVQQASGPATERLDALERSHHQFEARCEGLLLKAEGKLRSANNAEARTRADKKSYEHLVDPLAEDGEQPEAPHGTYVLGDDAPPGEAERLQALRLDVAPSPKELVKRAKFGVR